MLPALCGHISLSLSLPPVSPSLSRSVSVHAEDARFLLCVRQSCCDLQVQASWFSAEELSFKLLECMLLVFLHSV